MLGSHQPSCFLSQGCSDHRDSCDSLWGCDRPWDLPRGCGGLRDPHDSLWGYDSLCDPLRGWGCLRDPLEVVVAFATQCEVAAVFATCHGFTIAFAILQRPSQPHSCFELGVMPVDGWNNKFYNRHRSTSYIMPYVISSMYGIKYLVMLAKYR